MLRRSFNAFVGSLPFAGLYTPERTINDTYKMIVETVLDRNILVYDPNAVDNKPTDTLIKYMISIMKKYNMVPTHIAVHEDGHEFNKFNCVNSIFGLERLVFPDGTLEYFHKLGGALPPGKKFLCFLHDCRPEVSFIAGSQQKSSCQQEYYINRPEAVLVGAY